MNPLLNGINKIPQSGMNSFLANTPVGNIMQFMTEYKKLKSDPSGLGELLYSRGKINQQQLNDINKLNGDPSKIGEYLMNSGSINQNQMSQLQDGATQIQQYINNSPQ